MRVKVYSEKEEPEKVVRFKLIEEYNQVKLIACNASGKQLPGGYILVITTDGEIELCTSVSKDIGLSLDKNAVVVHRVES